MKTARFLFDNDLQPLLPKQKRSGSFTLAFKGEQSAKHLIEAHGVPHTEVGSVVANGQPVRLGYLVSDGDQIEVRSVFTLEEREHGVEVEPRFVLDNHLGRLAAYLRMLGPDCVYRNAIDDKELVEISTGEQRILLTRDRRLLMHKTIEHGYLVRSLIPREQLVEVVKRYHLNRWIKPFRRCLRCNSTLESVSKEAVLSQLEPLTQKYYDEFQRCPACDQVYWKGSHFERMLMMIDSLSKIN